MNILRFSLPGVATEAANARELQIRARKAGVRLARFDYQFAFRECGNGNSFRCRLTCSGQMSVFRIDQLRVAESDAIERGDMPGASISTRGSRQTYTSLMALSRSPSVDSPSDRRLAKSNSGRRGASR